MLGEDVEQQVVLTPVIRPGPRSVIEMGTAAPPDETVFFVGEGAAAGSTDLVCGQCQSVLVEGIRPNAVRNVVLRCAGCGAYNDTNTESSN